MNQAIVGVLELESLVMDPCVDEEEVAVVVDSEGVTVTAMLLALLQVVLVDHVRMILVITLSMSGKTAKRIRRLSPKLISKSVSNPEFPSVIILCSRFHSLVMQCVCDKIGEN